MRNGEWKAETERYRLLVCQLTLNMSHEWEQHVCLQGRGKLSRRLPPRVLARWEESCALASNVSSSIAVTHVHTDANVFYDAVAHCDDQV